MDVCLTELNSLGRDDFLNQLKRKKKYCPCCSWRSQYWWNSLFHSTPPVAQTVPGFPHGEGSWWRCGLLQQPEGSRLFQPFLGLSTPCLSGQQIAESIPCYSKGRKHVFSPFTLAFPSYAGLEEAIAFLIEAIAFLIKSLQEDEGFKCGLALPCYDVHPLGIAGNHSREF